MTKKDAIKELKQIKYDYQEFWEEYKDNNDYCKALNIGIEAVEKLDRIEEFLEITAHFNGVVKADYILKLMRGAEDD